MAKIGGGIVIALFGLFWCGITFLADSAFLFNSARQLAASRYAAVPGEITHSELKEQGKDQHDDATIRYRYEVAGVPYRGDRLRYDQMSFSRDRALQQIADYPVGKAITVYHDPADPRKAVLELDLDAANLFGLLFMSPFNALAFAFVVGFWNWLRSKRLGRPVAGVAVRDDGLTTTVRLYEFSPVLAALVGWGAVGFLGIFVVLLLSQAIGMEAAAALGWSAAFAAGFVAWRYALQRRTEIRRDVITGRVELLPAGGIPSVIAPQDLRGVRYSELSRRGSKGNRVLSYPVRLVYFDQDQQRELSQSFSEYMTSESAAEFAYWLNGVLGVEDLDRESKFAIEDESSGDAEDIDDEGTRERQLG